MSKNAFVLSLALFACMATTYASANESFQNEELDISGDFQQRPKYTAADRLKALRAKLEAQNEALVRKRIEHSRMQSELALMRKLQRTFEQNMKRMDSIK
jgi:hypothetical protein